VFTESAADLPSHQPQLRYLVYEKSGNKHTRLPDQGLADEVVETGIPREILHFDVRRGKDRAQVIIYELSDAEYLEICRRLAERKLGHL
jgi:hypothetical protein